MSKLAELMTEITATLARYKFPPIVREDRLQELVADVLGKHGIACEREVVANEGRYDVSVRRDDLHVVLELKVRASTASVERQAQRYALSQTVDAVIVLTTSHRLHAQLEPGTLPGEARGAQPGDAMVRKPFAVMLLRCSL